MTHKLGVFSSRIFFHSIAQASGGFVSVQAIIILVLFCAALALSPKNMELIEKRWSVYQAESFYQQIAATLNARNEVTNKVPIVMVLNQVGPAFLPYPFEQVLVPEGVTLDFAIRFWFVGFIDLRLLQIRHPLGEVSSKKSRIFRCFEINGKRVEQVIVD